MINVWVISPGMGVVVFVGVRLGVGDREGCGEFVSVADGDGGAAVSNGLRHALSSMTCIQIRTTEVGARFIRANCTLRKPRSDGLYRDERCSGIQEFKWIEKLILAAHAPDCIVLNLFCSHVIYII